MKGDRVLANELEKVGDDDEWVPPEDDTTEERSAQSFIVEHRSCKDRVATCRQEMESEETGGKGGKGRKTHLTNEPATNGVFLLLADDRSYPYCTRCALVVVPIARSRQATPRTPCLPRFCSPRPFETRR